VLLRVAGIVLPLVCALAVVVVPKPWPPTLTLAVLALLIVVAAIQILLLVREKKSELRAAFTGSLESRLTAGAFPELEIGDSGVILRYVGPGGHPLPLSIFEGCHLTIEVPSASVDGDRGRRHARGTGRTGRRLAGGRPARPWL
jgi:hypothetical protein